MKTRVKSGPISAPSMKGSIAAAGAAEAIKDKMEGNGISHGEKPVVAPPDAPEGAPSRAERRCKAQEKPKPADVPPQGRTGAKGKQSELPGMPKLDGVGLAARKFLDTIDALETAKEARENAMSNVINALKRAKRKEINVDGYTISYTHRAAVDLIKVKKPSGQRSRQPREGGAFKD